MVTTRSFYETTREERIELARTMHEHILEYGDEEIWYDWTFTMPDEPDDEDFEWYADDEWEWADLCALYNNLMRGC